MSDSAGAFQNLIDKACVARPKAVYREAFIENRSENTVVVDRNVHQLGAARNLANVEQCSPLCNVRKRWTSKPAI